MEKTEYLKQASDADRRSAQGRGYIKEYGPYGLTIDQSTGYLSYKGRLVEVIRDTAGCGTYVTTIKAADREITCLLIVRGGDESVEQVVEMDEGQMSELLKQTIGVYREGDRWIG